MEKKRNSASKQKSEKIVASGKCFEKSEQNVKLHSDEKLVLDSVKVHLCLFGQRARSFLLGARGSYFCRLFLKTLPFSSWGWGELKVEPSWTG